MAFKPFAQIPQIPHVERMEQLKTYGDADSTESTSALTLAFCPNATGLELTVYVVPLIKLVVVPNVATVPSIRYENTFPFVSSIVSIEKVPLISSSRPLSSIATN